MMTEMQMEMVLLGAALIEVNGCLFAFDGKNDGKYGKDDYSREELVAEIGSASLCATLGLDTAASMTNSAAYIANWLKALRNDKRMIVWAASRAEKAVRMILNMEVEA